VTAADKIILDLDREVNYAQHMETTGFLAAKQYLGCLRLVADPAVNISGSP